METSNGIWVNYTNTSGAQTEANLGFLNLGSPDLMPLTLGWVLPEFQEKPHVLYASISLAY